MFGKQILNGIDTVLQHTPRSNVWTGQLKVMQPMDAASNAMVWKLKSDCRLTGTEDTQSGNATFSCFFWPAFTLQTFEVHGKGPSVSLMKPDQKYG